MSIKNVTSYRVNGFILMVWVLLLLPGCLATQSWVNQRLVALNTRMTDMEQQVSKSGSRFAAADPRITSQVSEEIQPLEKRVTAIEKSFSGFENRLTSAEGQFNELNAKANQSLGKLKDLQITRRLVMDLRQGANFRPSSAELSERAKRNIDSFLESLDRKSADDHLFFIAGYTDNTGSSDLNFKLGHKRAESVGRYLIVDKLIHPARVTIGSGGDRDPAAPNTTPLGREQNRRVEIIVYKNAITKTSPEISATLSRMAITPKVARRK